MHDNKANALALTSDLVTLAEIADAAQHLADLIRRRLAAKGTHDDRTLKLDLSSLGHAASTWGALILQ